MFNLDTNNIMQRAVDRMFRKVDNVVWDLMSGELGVRNTNNKSSSEGSIFVRGPVEKVGESDTEVDFDIKELLFDNFTMPIPAFAQITQRDQVKPGDMVIMGSGATGWVTKINPKSFTIRKIDGQTTNWTPTKVETIGLPSPDGVMVVRSLVQMTGGDASGLQGMQNSLMPLLMMGGDSSSLESMIPMMLMMQANGGNNSNGMAGMMQAMMMASMFSKGGKNPFQR